MTTPEPIKKHGKGITIFVIGAIATGVIGYYLKKHLEMSDLSDYMYIQKLGGVYTKFGNPPVEGLEFKMLDADYVFFPNNRVFAYDKKTGQYIKRGSYDKKMIKWDGGGEMKLKEAIGR